MDYGSILQEVHQGIQPLLGKGKVADYIPALAEVKPTQFGMALRTVDGQDFQVGAATKPFSIQSISKVLALTLAIRFEGEKIWERVGREPSGNPFNSLVQLEYENGIPRNPFINAGALVITDIIMSHTSDANALLRDFVRQLTGNESLDYNESVATSERQAGFRNAALCNFLKSFGNIKHDVEEVLDTYFHQCALVMSAADLSRAFMFLANGGVNPLDGRAITTVSQAKRINALMLTCGLYDEGGDFAFLVGLPGKSGVGGGIATVLPGKWALSVWSPGLNPNHNSLCGMKALEMFTTLTGESIF